MNGRRKVEERLDRLLASVDPAGWDPIEFWKSQFDAGLAFVSFPEGEGGLGVAPGLQKLVDDRLAEAGAPSDNIRRNPIGYGMGAPVVAIHGTPQQRRRWLRPLFCAQEIWCQLFSEPGAGSDVAGLATLAAPDGDEWVVNGQKVWTTLAHTARWGMLLARTSADLPKHEGLTYFVVDMDQPGVEVRPLRQMTGEAEFNEVYFSDARVPDDYRLGGVGEGWRVAITTLMHERSYLGSETPPRGGGVIAAVVDAWRKSAEVFPERRDDVVRAWVEAEVARLTSLRWAELIERGNPGPGGATGKLQWAELFKRLTDLGLELLGPAGMLYPSTYAMVRPDLLSPTHHDPQKGFLRARAASIEGGTSEIMRNILGERVLGLPGEPRVDKDIPWKQVARS